MNNIRESAGLKHFYDPRAFIEYSNDMQDVYFKVPKDVRLNITHVFIMKIRNKIELQQIALNH